MIDMDVKKDKKDWPLIVFVTFASVALVIFIGYLVYNLAVVPVQESKKLANEAVAEKIKAENKAETYSNLFQKEKEKVTKAEEDIADKISEVETKAQEQIAAAEATAAGKIEEVEKRTREAIDAMEEQMLAQATPAKEVTGEEVIVPVVKKLVLFNDSKGSVGIEYRQGKEEKLKVLRAMDKFSLTLDAGNAIKIKIQGKEKEFSFLLEDELRYHIE
jgi:hypothetical protein